MLISSCISVPPLQGLRSSDLNPGLTPWAVLPRLCRAARPIVTVQYPGGLRNAQGDCAIYGLANPEGVEQDSPGREPWERVMDLRALKGRHKEEGL